MRDNKLFLLRIGGVIASIIGMICTAFVQQKENEKNIEKFVKMNMKKKSGK